MKKLLTLLSVVTISGTAVPTTIAASPYKKQQKLNSEINYQKINNLEINNQKLSTNDYLELNNKIIEKVDILPKFEEMNNKSILNNYFIKDNDFYFLNKSNNISEKINGIESEINSWNKVIFSDKKNNVYFGTNDGLYTLKYGEITASKLNITNGIQDITFGDITFGIIDNDGNIYIGTSSSICEALYVIKMKNNNNLLVEINDVRQMLLTYHIGTTASKKVVIDNKNNAYVLGYGNYIYIIKSGETTATKIENIYLDDTNVDVAIDSKNNAYILTSNALYILKYKENTINKIIETNYYLNLYLYIDNNDNVYFKLKNEVFVLKSEKINAFEIIKAKNITDLIIRNNNFYFIENEHKAYILKKDDTMPIEINSNNNPVTQLFVDNNENIYVYADIINQGNLYLSILKKNTNTPIKIYGVSGPISYIFEDNNNNIYIGSGNGLYTLKSGETTATKIKIENSSQISGFVFDNNNLYFGTDYSGVFVIKSGETTATKIEGINWHYGVYAEIYQDKKYDIIYFKTGGALYKLSGGENKVSKIIEGEDPKLFISDNNNNTYYINYDNNIYVLKKDKVNPQKINEINDVVFSIERDNNDNIYFGTNDGLYTLKSGETTATKISNINEKINEIVINNNNDIFLGTNNGSYILKSGETTVTKISNINEKINEIINNKDNIYFILSNGLYLFQNKLTPNQIININNLEKINNDGDKTILNTLNYLNRENNYFLNLNKMKVINKTSTSAAIEATKEKYRGQITVNYKIENKDESSNVDLNDLLKKAAYFDFIDKNFYSVDKIKEIKNINIDNLNFGNIEVTRNNNLKWGINNFKDDICFNERERTNNSSIKKTVKIPKCEYNQKSKFMFQVIKGISKNRENNPQTDWTLNEDDENKLTDFVNINYRNKTITHVISNNFDFSNLNKQKQEIILYLFNESEDEIELAPNEKVTIAYSVRESKYESILNLKQKITGNITAKIIDDNSEEKIITSSIKEAMQILQKYSLLPDEITINEDNSIIFNGKAILSLTRDGKPKLNLRTEII